MLRESDLREPHVNRAVWRGLLLATMVWPRATSGAQSTADVGHAGRPVTIEVSGGGQRASRTESYGNFEHDGVVAAAVTLRKAVSELGALRLTSLLLARNAGEGSSSPSFSYQLDREDRIAALIAGVGGAWRVWDDATIEPSVGAGLAPYVHRDQRMLPGTTAGTAPREAFARSTVGWVWAAGIGAHYRGLFVEQSVYVIQGADNVISHAGAFYPLTVGWRF